MRLTLLINDKTKKAKEKTATISEWLLSGALPAEELIAFAENLKDAAAKATCIEAIEFATKQHPQLVTESIFSFITNLLTEEAPRVKWESAKVIGNTAHLFSAKLSKAISHLLDNAKSDGTVVRWASAYALSEILKLKTKHNKILLPAIEAICHAEDDNAVKKKYLDALRKIKK